MNETGIRVYAEMPMLDDLYKSIDRHIELTKALEKNLFEIKSKYLTLNMYLTKNPSAATNGSDRL